MKLSEAMREGAKLRPQCRYKFFDYGIYDHRGVKLADGDVLQSCPLGAVYEAIFHAIAPPQEIFRALVEKFPELLAASKDLPDLAPDIGEWVKGSYAPLLSAINYLSIQKLWSREQIADWLEARGL